MSDVTCATCSATKEQLDAVVTAAERVAFVHRWYDQDGWESSASLPPEVAILSNCVRDARALLKKLVNDDAKCICGCDRGRHIEIPEHGSCRGCDDCCEYRPVDAKCICGQPGDSRVVHRKDGPCHYRPAEEPKCSVCGCTEREHVGAYNPAFGKCLPGTEQRMGPCPDFRPAEESKPNPATESVYERARKALDNMGLRGGVLRAALDTGEAAEKRAEAAEQHIKILEEEITAGRETWRTSAERAEAAEARVRELEMVLTDWLGWRDKIIEQLQPTETDTVLGDLSLVVALAREDRKNINTALVLLKPARPEDGLLPAIRDVMQLLVLCEKETPQPIAKCPKCGADWFTTDAGFCREDDERRAGQENARRPSPDPSCKDCGGIGVLQFGSDCSCVMRDEE